MWLNYFRAFIMNSDFKRYLLELIGSSDCEEVEVIQSLWSGYGKISRYRVDGNGTLVVKCISLQAQAHHPRGWNTDIGHQRKVRSYEVETNWYENWSERCTEQCRIPKFMGSFKQGAEQWIVLEDLDLEFPKRRSAIDLAEVKTVLSWLTHFHATFMGCTPDGLWEVGTYWHLATRPDELEKMQHAELKAKAHAIDARLNECRYQTIVHGDAKLANFCFSADGERVAAVDFQYVGGGCGMKDVAYFLGSCLSSEEQERYETELLDHYFVQLRDAMTDMGSDVVLTDLEQEWRELYPYACVDFLRFLLGWMPAHQKVNGYNLMMVNDVLSDV